MKHGYSKMCRNEAYLGTDTAQYVSNTPNICSSTTVAGLTIENGMDTFRIGLE